MKKVASQDPQPTAEVGNVITRADTALYRLHLGRLTAYTWLHLGTLGSPHWPSLQQKRVSCCCSIKTKTQIMFCCSHKVCPLHSTSSLLAFRFLRKRVHPQIAPTKQTVGWKSRKAQAVGAWKLETPLEYITISWQLFATHLHRIVNMWNGKQIYPESIQTFETLSFLSIVESYLRQRVINSE